jgi:hypothetical protein
MVLVGKLGERDHFQDLGVNGRAWTGVTRLKISAGVRILCRWRITDYIKCGEFLCSLRSF